MAMVNFRSTFKNVKDALRVSAFLCIVCSVYSLSEVLNVEKEHFHSKKTSWLSLFIRCRFKVLQLLRLQ